MGIREALTIINEMEAAGVIDRYALGGAVAAFNYIEPAVTQDIDVFVSFDAAGAGGAKGLITLTPILSYLASRGFDRFDREGVVIADWPVQFLPIASALDEEALREAEEMELFAAKGNPVRTRIFQPEHLVALALSVGRPKDYARIIQFLDAGAVDAQRLDAVLNRHELREKWREFRLRMGIPSISERPHD